MLFLHFCQKLLMPADKLRLLWIKNTMKRSYTSHLKWQFLPIEQEGKAQALAEQLSTKSEFPLAIARILVQRGVDTYEKARYYFAPQLEDLPDPMLMQDMSKAVARLKQAFEQKEKILIYGDYDVDGTTAVTLWSIFASAWGFEYSMYIPDRYQEGYGLSFKGVDFAVQENAQILISLDCGIKAVEKVAYANSKEIDVIICDHHVPGAQLPEAHAILDPKRGDCPYPFKELTGCGIGYKLAVALHAQLLAAGHQPVQADFDPEKHLLDLLALSIACDIVPLVDENRTLAFYGLKKMQKQPQKGIKAIMDLSDRERSWDISDLVFFIGPHVNAAGRLGHAMEAVSVLLGKKEDLQQLANALGESNQARKDLDKQITEEALDLIIQDQHYPQKNSTVLYKESWHKGVIGIVASRLIERHYRPTVLLTKSEGKWVGSARSVMGFNLYEALEACQEHILQFGGHMYAAGLTIKEDMLTTFSHAFEEAVSSRITPAQKKPILTIDQRINFSDISDRFVRLIQRMGPFGPKNMTPVFMSEDVEVLEAKILKDAHVRLLLKQDGIVFTAIGFQLAEKWERLNCLKLDIAFQPTFNTWKDRTTINLVLKDIQNPHDQYAH